MNSMKKKSYNRVQRYKELPFQPKSATYFLFGGPINSEGGRLRTKAVYFLAASVPFLLLIILEF